ncbi:hypothetical protein EVJ58_g9222 [Rhodofomes roseus]|uniref:Uncharacterized protein n=1 Tax=Rhodofomes roseus TaxID=34475 RepID=A0A4Y9XWM6_9APHY|nr:hypothetical protein EVJ58_g9222 [Rhodofomes roseus]
MFFFVMEPVIVVQGVIDLTFQVVAAAIRAVLAEHGVVVSGVISKPPMSKPSSTWPRAGRFQGINPGAGISRFSKEIISRYGPPLGFVEGDIPKCYAALDEAYAKKVAKSIAAKLPDGTIEALHKLCISNEGVARMDYLHAVEGKSPDEAVAKWIAESELQL